MVNIIIMHGLFDTLIILFHLTGWDINSCNLADACERARVLDIGIQDQLRPYLEKMKPRPSIYCQDFIAANQEERANNILQGTKAQMMEQIRADIRDFKTSKKLDKVSGKFIIIFMLCFRFSMNLIDGIMVTSAFNNA